MSDAIEETRQEERLEKLERAIESGRLLPVQRALHALHPAEIALLIESTPPHKRELVWSVVNDEDRGDVLLHVNDEVRESLLAEMETHDVVAAAEGMDADDLADFIEHLPETVTQQVLRSLDLQNRKRLESLLAYGADTAGGLMNTDTVTVRPDVSVDVVLRYLRLRGEVPASTDKLFVVDRYDRYLGAVDISSLLTTGPDEPVSEIMDRDVKALQVTINASDVARHFENLDLVSAPVVDSGDILLGRITIDDVVDVIRDEAEHSIMSMAGLDEEDDMFAPVPRSARRRAVWLGINLCTALLASWVVGLFQATINEVVALAVLMPVVASMGGIGGSQTLTLMIRGLALGQIGSANMRSLLRREILVAIINGVVWALVVSAITLFWFKNPMLGVVIAIAMVANQVVAAFAGVGIPLMMKRIGVDPALAGGVVLTTITDVVGFFAFLGLGAALLL